MAPVSRLTSLTGCLCTSSPQGLLQFEVKGGDAGGGGGGGGEGGRPRRPSCPVHTERKCEQGRRPTGEMMEGRLEIHQD